MKKFIVIFAVVVLASCSGKKSGGGIMAENLQESISFESISMDSAVELLKKSDGHILVDVRREDEYLDGHIPGAILLVNEFISSQSAATVLPDKNQLVYVYCRSGRRSKEAASKLVALGYTRIVEIGGILDWNGDIEK